MSIKQLRDVWSTEIEQDVKAYHDIDLESEIADTLAAEMNRDVLFEIARLVLGEPKLPRWRDLNLPSSAAELKQQLEDEYKYWYEAVTSTDAEVAKQARLVYNKTYETAQTYASLAGTNTERTLSIDVVVNPAPISKFMQATFTVPGPINNDSDT